MSRRAEHPLHRLTALLAVLCMLALAVFAASPDLHARLHGGDAAGQSAPVGDADHDCVVTHFAGGVSALPVFCLLLLGRTPVRSLFRHAADEIAAAHPRYRLVPSHAPPAA
jgi:hypothetical protein